MLAREVNSFDMLQYECLVIVAAYLASVLLNVEKKVA